jgi:SAM-dependent methyltransferase
MAGENFKPISIKAPSSNPLLFSMRCLVDLQMKTVVRHLRPAMAKLEGRVIDVGAGESPWKEWLGDAASYHGLDIADAADFGMQSGRKDVTYYDGRKMPFEARSFDSAICIEVLEHAEDPLALLSEISRVLRPDGTLLLSVPWSARRHHIPYDFHRFTRERLQAMLDTSGFHHICITERGSDISVVANKLMVISMRLLKPAAWRPLRILPTLVCLFFMLPLTAAWLLFAHIAERFGLGAREDPLGYFVSAQTSSDVTKKT